jgi:septum formation topological specificity factor MinE
MKSPKYSKKSKSKTYKLRMYKKGSKKRSRIKKRSRSKMYKSSKKRSRVKSKMYKSSKKRRSQKRSKSKVRIPIKQKGLLFGYHIDMTAKSRRSLLKKLLSKRKATYSQIIKRLNVLTIYNKNRHPDISEKIKRDIDFVHRHFQKYSLVYKNKSKRKSTPKRKSKYKW